MKKIIATAIAGAALLVSGGIAHADGYLTPGEIAVADTFHGTIGGYIDDNGVTTSSMTELMGALYQRPEIANYGDAVDVINYTVKNYCPRHWSELVSFGSAIRGSHI